LREPTDERIDLLAATLDEGFRTDSQDSFGTRRLGFFKDVEDISILIRITRDPDGSAAMGAQTLCLS